MRYFLCTVASRPWVVGDHTFIFEPTALRGGQWLGVLALDEPDASILSNANLVQIGEIDQAYYEDQKKKERESASSSLASPVPQRTELLGFRIAEPAANPTTPGSGNVPSAAIQSETLLTTTLEPPGDPLLEDRTSARYGPKGLTK